jgi:hypothetical protein
MFWAIISCNENDGINISNGSAIRPVLDLVKIKETTYSGGDAISYRVRIIQSSRFTIDSTYNQNKETTGYTKWNYDAQSFLTSIQQFDATNTIIKQEDLEYDADRNLTKLTEGSDFIEYTHNNDDSASGTFSDGTNITFFPNEFRRFNRTATNTEETELFFTAAQVDSLRFTDLSTSTVTNRVIYKYINAFPPKGFLISTIIKNTFRNQNNAVLYTKNLNNIAHIYSDKYFSSIQKGNENTTFEYILDVNSYPIIYNTFINGDFHTSVELFYE